MPTEMALTAMRAFEAEVEIVIDITLDKRRAKDRERQAKKRERDNVKSRDVTLQCVTNVTTRDRRDAKNAHAPTYTRGEDISLPLENIPNLTTLQRERDWKNRADLEWLDSQLREAGGPAVANLAIAPGLADLSTIIGLLTGGTGPPCDLEADVLPVIRARCIGRKQGSVRAWNLFRDAIREARDRRLTGAPAVEPFRQGPPHDRSDPNTTKFAAKQANMERALRAAQSVAARG